MIDLRHGDCLQVLKELDDCSIDSIVTDPPYGLSFMGKGWDYQVPSVEIWEQCLRVLKPGGHLLAFAGTRTQHRMCVNIEDAGFEIRDMIAWVYGSGFPKSQNLGKAIDKAAGAEREVIGFDSVAAKRTPGVGTAVFGDYKGQSGSITAPATPEAQQWDGWGTALKPALEPITVARKPFKGTVANNVLEHGTGAINIDGCRVAPTGESKQRTGEASQDARYTDKGSTNFAAKPGIRGGDPAGRWPANVIHDGSDEVTELFPETKSGNVKAYQRTNRSGWAGPTPEQSTFEREGDSGSAARFFYCAKANKKDRGEGNSHPTVKPTNLMAYLVRLVTPSGGVVLDPFMGSGSTGKAAAGEGFSFIGIEREVEYFQIAEKRVQGVEIAQGKLDLAA